MSTGFRVFHRIIEHSFLLKLDRWHCQNDGNVSTLTLSTSWISLCPRYEASRLFFFFFAWNTYYWILHTNHCVRSWGYKENVTSSENVTQSCPALCDPMDCSSTGSSVHGIFQVRIVEWVAIPFSGGSFWPRNWTQVSCIASGFFTIWATRGAWEYKEYAIILLQEIKGLLEETNGQKCNFNIVV